MPVPAVIAKGYTSKAIIGRYLNETITAGSQFEQLVNEAIAYAEAAVEDYCDRVFAVSKETRIYDGDGTSELLPGDILSITTLKVDGMTISSTHYYLYPNNALPKTKIVLDTQVFTDDFQNVEITGLFGYQTALPTTGTADSGTTTTLTDNALTQAEGFWVDYLLSIIAGPSNGETRRVTDFNATTDTLSIDSNLPFSSDLTAASEYALGRVPPMILHACNRIVAAMLRPYGQIGNLPLASEGFGGYSVSYDTAMVFIEMDPYTQRLLRPFRRPSFGVARAHGQR